MDEGSPPNKNQACNQHQSDAGNEGSIPAATHCKLSPDVKKRKMEDQKCSQQSRTDLKAGQLTDHAVFKTSSRDVNLCLYSKQGASAMYSQDTASYEGASSSSNCAKSMQQQSHSEICLLPDLDGSTSTSSNRGVDVIPAVNTPQSISFCNNNLVASSGARVQAMTRTNKGVSPIAKSGHSLDEFEAGTIDHSISSTPKKNMNIPLQSVTEPACTGRAVSGSPAKSDSLIDEFENDTSFDEYADVVDFMERTASHSCESLPKPDSLVGEFENDAMLDRPEVVDIVEKAESTASSPPKSFQGSTASSPSKSAQESTALSPCKSVQGFTAASPYKSAQGSTALSPCKTVQGFTASSPYKSVQGFTASSPCKSARESTASSPPKSFQGFTASSPYKSVQGFTASSPSKSAQESTALSPCKTVQGFTASSHYKSVQGFTASSPCKSARESIASSACKSAQGRRLDEFEDDAWFVSPAVLDVVEKAESTAPSPSKSAQESPCKSAQESTASRPSKSAQESPTSSPCKGAQESTTSRSSCKSAVGQNLDEVAYDTTEKVESDPASQSECQQGGNWQTGTFSVLPVEVIENIFCNVPMMDLGLSLSLVCKSWKEIIKRKKFLKWKKRYHRYKLQESDTCTDLYRLIMSCGMTQQEGFLLKIIKYVQDFRKWFGSSMVENLKQHHNFELAKDLIEQRAPELMKDGISNPWCLIAALAILAETVSDVTLIIKCLLNPMATCTAVDVTECLYCVATFLLQLQRRHNCNRGLHYRVFYALYLYESSISDVAAIQSPSKANNQRSKGKQSSGRPRQNTERTIHLTHEQKRIVTYDPRPNEVIKIVAFAGTGKTTTLIQYAQRRFQMKFLYVAFNRSVREHAQKVFPNNVISMTTHGLAFNALHIGPRYKNKGLLGHNLFPRIIHKILPRESAIQKSGLHWLTRAKLVIDTLTAFMNSKEDFITTLHVPTTYKKKNRMLTDLQHAARMKLADDATIVWERLISESNTKYCITHDVYLKMYHLRKPILDEYDCILIDEAQDLTPVQQDILLTQSCSKIMVGDPNQQIYSFRGAENAMDQIQRHVGEGMEIKTFHLTQSFRFGPEIAYVSNLLLEFLKKNTTQFIVGTGKQGSIHGEEVGTVAIICRSNEVLFDQAVRICTEALRDDKNLRLGYAGGIDGYNLDIIIDIYKLLNGADNENIQNKFIKTFDSFADLRSYASNAMDGELEGKISTVLKYGDRLPNLIMGMKRRTTWKLEDADIVLSTAHKSKGLEFDTVKLAEDFALESFLLLANGQHQGRIHPDELNLIYVAVTRAKKRLVLNYHLLKFLEYAMETFEYPVSAKSVLAMLEEVPHCLECKELIEETANVPLITKRPKLKICFRPTSSIIPPNNGYLCARCSAQTFPWLFELCGQEYKGGVSTQGSARDSGDTADFDPINLTESESEEEEASDVEDIEVDCE